MQALPSQARGRYVVRTLTAQYRLDLDRAVIVREPAPSTAPGAPVAAALRRDGTEIALLAVLTCQVGVPMTLLLHLAPDAPTPITYRQTTPVTSIAPDGPPNRPAVR